MYAHPQRFAWTTLRRFVFTWTGYWDLSRAYRRIEPFELPNLFFTVPLSAFSALGLARAFHRARHSAILFAWVLVAFPAIYYLTHPSMLYRHPVDPLIVLLAVYAFTDHRKERESIFAPPRGVEVEAQFPHRVRVKVPLSARERILNRSGAAGQIRTPQFLFS